MRRRKALARSVRGIIERLEARTFLSAVLSEGLGTATISGTVYDDLNGNGVQDAGEPVSAGVSVHLAEVGVSYGAGGIPTVQTDAIGNFNFNGLAAGQYQATISPDPSLGLVQDAPGVVVFTVSAGASDSYLIGETVPGGGGSGAGSIVGTVFNDFNQTNMYNPMTDQTLAGDTVYIDLNGSGVLAANDPQTTSSNTGTYSFPPGSKSMQTLTFASNTTGGTFILDFSDANVSPAVPVTPTAPIPFDPTNGPANAMAIQTAIDAIDPNAGVTVAATDAFHYTVIYNIDGPQAAIATDVATALTLAPPTTGGLTSVTTQMGTATLPAVQTLTFGPMTSGGSFALDVSDNSTMPIVLTKATGPITFNPTNVALDIANIRNAINQIDPIPAGVTVTSANNPFQYTVTYNLLGAQNTIGVDRTSVFTTAASPLTETIVNTGTISVSTGVLEVRVVPRIGFHQDPPGYDLVTVLSDQQSTQNIGENNRTTISGTVFDDRNGNGIQDPGEPPVAGESVFLDVVGDGILFQPPIDNRATDPHVTTDSNGHYILTGVASGFYRVEIQSSAGLIMDSPMYADATVAPAQDLAVNLAEGLPATVTGVVFDDKNADGVRNPGEPGVLGQTVFLDVNNDGVLEANPTPIAADGLPLWYAEPNVSSAADGTYTFSNLAPGTYTLRVITPPGGVETGPNDPSHSYTFTLTSGTTLAGQDFGYQTPDLTITALKYPTKTVFGGTPLRAVARITNVGHLTAIGDAGIHLLYQDTSTGLFFNLGAFGGKAIHIAPGQSKLLTLNFSYPTQTPTGLYNIVAYVVSNVHDNDAPNDRFHPIGPVQIVLPVVDLQNVYAAQPVTIVDPGQAITLALAVTNLGNVTSVGELAFRIYLASDKVVEPNGTAVQTTFFKNTRLKPHQTRIFTVTVPYPGPALGSKYVIVNVDSGAPLGETNVANNFAVPLLQTLFGDVVVS